MQFRSINIGPGRQKPEAMVDDPTAWMVDGPLAGFLLMHTKEIKYMCMLGYTFMGGCKVFGAVSPDAAVSYKFVNMVLACTGGGIFVPVFLNLIPVPLATDAYIIAISCSFFLHYFFPVLRDVMKISPLFKICIVVMFETLRATVVCTFTKAAAANIPASQFSFPLFGPIICGSIAGCGAAFMPMNKGLEPMKNGLAPPMLTALLGAAGYHLYLSTSLSDGTIDAEKKAKVHVAAMFVSVGLAAAFNVAQPATVTAAKKNK
eukprot:CAMPEP_0195521538 /NCGR_PEP_ID=MMETSP0794_2-20130614/18913_1 /TAXON_ID=515487 /ORGANISM="Stephanopyxis turris, Strain CCMP 815" /LENGTH=260 /DNA_ID=CAMNT_0040651113 /DNA_START=1 /DNA_END=783 /DNA_ORIENTATION=+